MLGADTYPLHDRRPQLIDSFVLYLDVLGTKHLAEGKRAQEHLDRLFEALDAVREQRILQAEKGLSRVLTFTDNLVLGSPARGPYEAITGTLGGILFEASLYQLELSCRGIFVRGGLARGPFFMREDFAFGPALGAAYDLERTVAVYPRIVLSRPVLKLLQEDTRFYGRIHDSPQFHQVLLDGSGNAFLNYLDILTEPDVDIEQQLGKHKDALESALAASARDAKVWGKYRWLADYHNYVCFEYFPAYAGLQIGGDKTATTFRRLAKSRKPWSLPP